MQTQKAQEENPVDLMPPFDAEQADPIMPTEQSAQAVEQQPAQQQPVEEQFVEEQPAHPDAAKESTPLPAEPRIEEKLAEAEAKVAEIQDAFLRAKAESENIRRRSQEEISRAHRFAVEGFAETLLPVKDSLETALQVETSSVDSYKQGVEMTLKQLSAAFEKNRLTEINPGPGDKFDPARHQAISMIPVDQSSGTGANTIVSVLQKGYMIADRLLRPALVTVSEERPS
jgi:molecular chaperone GrpE